MKKGKRKKSIKSGGLSLEEMSSSELEQMIKELNKRKREKEKEEKENKKKDCIPGNEFFVCYPSRSQVNKNGAMLYQFYINIDKSGNKISDFKKLDRKAVYLGSVYSKEVAEAMMKALRKISSQESFDLFDLIKTRSKN